MNLQSIICLMFWIAGVAAIIPLTKWVCIAYCLSNHWLFLTSNTLLSSESSLESFHNSHIQIEITFAFPLPTVDMFRQLSHILDWSINFSHFGFRRRSGFCICNSDGFTNQMISANLRCKNVVSKTGPRSSNKARMWSVIREYAVVTI